LADLGISSLIFGPGSIDVAHAPDEYIEIQALQRAVGMVQDVVRARCF
jgi:acetylornithine deacetylase